MKIILLSRSQMQRQTASNLIAAGVIVQDEADLYYEILSAMSIQEVVAALLESHQLREGCPEPIFYYPVGEISLN